jgi:hypothetical protein
MRLLITAHAAEMMEERGIDIDWVKAVLADPPRITADPRGAPPQRAYGVVPSAGGRMLRVVFRQDGDAFVIVTTHFDRGSRP